MSEQDVLFIRYLFRYAEKETELKEANPSLQPKELQALVKLTLSAEQAKEQSNE